MNMYVIGEYFFWKKYFKYIFKISILQILKLNKF